MQPTTTATRTNVTGIVAGRGMVAPIGVAPAASVVAVKVLGRNNEFAHDLADHLGLNWVAPLNRPDVRVVNIDLGTFALYPGTCDGADTGALALASAVSALRARGVTLFASAGNEASPNALAAPACLSGVVAVGAVYDGNVGPIVVEDVCSDPATSVDKIACFSNSGGALDLLAPGALIVSAGRGGGTSTFAGTCQASPHAAGAAALLLQQTPTLTPDAVESALESTGVPLTDARNGLAPGRGSTSPPPCGSRRGSDRSPTSRFPAQSRSEACPSGGAGCFLFLVTNGGNGVLTVRGSSRPPFAVVSKQPLTVPGRARGPIIQVRFAPGAPRTFRGTLTLTSNDPDERRATVVLRGTGTRR